MGAWKDSNQPLEWPRWWALTLIKSLSCFLKVLFLQTWNSELAKFAELNVKQCKLQHDKCRSTSAYKFAGQNIGFQAQSGEFEPLKGALEKVLAGWFDEHKDASQSDIDKCCTSKSGKVIGHFTQLVRDRAIQVGCAVSRFTQENVWKSSLVTCNYAITNLVDNPVYESGTAASGCTTGPNPDYFALCSVNEPIKVVPVWSYPHRS